MNENGTYDPDAPLQERIPIELTDAGKYNSDELRQLGQVVTFTATTGCTRSAELLTFGHVSIQAEVWEDDDDR